MKNLYLVADDRICDDHCIFKTHDEAVTFIRSQLDLCQWPVAGVREEIEQDAIANIETRAF